MSEKEIGVYVDIPGDTCPVRVGTLWACQAHRRESAKFAYASTWLNSPCGYALEPALPMVAGIQYTAHALFGCMEDSSPDRWGRTLINRAETLSAREEGRPRSHFTEADYMLGVSDETRQGALRFSVDGGNTFMNSDAGNVVPPLINLPKLLHAADMTCEEKAGWDDLHLLLAPGSSLGGAWPKSCVRDTDGRLCIAKFSRQDQDRDVVAWEAVLLGLAKRAGLEVPPFRLLAIPAGRKQRHVLLVQKFDRDAANARIPYLSAMSLLDATDGEQRSYMELAEAMVQHCARPERCLPELWRRMVFSLMVSNTDDHMRNHGFVRRRGGWQLSPLFDVNPTPPDVAPRILATPLTPGMEEVDKAPLLELAPYFGIRGDAARQEWASLAAAVAGWRAEASRYHIPPAEQERMAGAFSPL